MIAAAPTTAHDRSTTSLAAILQRHRYHCALVLAWTILLTALYVGATP